MAKIEDIPKMAIEELRPLVQRAIGLETWPESDWIVVGMIFDQVGIQVSRAAGPPHIFSVIVMDKGMGRGIGSAVNPDPVIATFRAYLKWRSYQMIRENKNNQ